MLLALSVISSQGAGMGATAYKVFDERGGSVGRLDSNDWALPDPEKFVSSRHAELKFSAGRFYLEDVSTNGTFINVPDRPVPRTEPTVLRDGDRIFIGDYEILVQLIDDGAPAAAAPSAVGSDGGLGTVDPLAVIGADATSMRPPAAALASGAPAASLGPAPGFAQQQASPVAIQGTARATGPTVSADGMLDLLNAMGLEPSRVEPSIYQQLGAIIRTVVQGMIEVLQARSEVKNNFRMPMTNIRPVENNPLKFSLNADDALHNLFVKRNPGYLGPLDSFTESFQDVAFHQVAMLAGIRAAYNSMLEKFKPEHLEAIYERKLRRSSVIGFGQRSKFWEMYREQFEDIDKDMEANFQLLFGEEFAKAYNDQLNKLAAAARARQR